MMRLYSCPFCHKVFYFYSTLFDHRVICKHREPKAMTPDQPEGIR